MASHTLPYPLLCPVLPITLTPSPAFPGEPTLNVSAFSSSSAGLLGERRRKDGAQGRAWARPEVKAESPTQIVKSVGSWSDIPQVPPGPPR